ncbi:hypothetical protein [Pengzhenrongella frigida]|uniref:Uncharacterized protein n=1 Tax=Pengzhenrongella frigida TaxID=1259133 RepID=A0A4V1ZHB6_9MICO|nr:hypothetical protein [Cellulomonas sp. HLT2-17]RYV51474.1 hypothetical protein EUA98_08595 [Cellulomonas sp. HLT2-17]
MPDDASTPANPRFTRSAALWLRAYPRRWRAARAAEMTEVLADLAEPGASRLGLRDAVDVIRNGWATRWREHPPARPWLAFRLTDRRLPAQYDAWLWDDLTGGLYPFRKTWPVLFFAAVVGIDNGPYPGVVALMVWVLLGFAVRGATRRAALARYFPRNPDPSLAAVLGPSGFRRVPRARIAARPVLRATALVGLTAAGAMLSAGRFAAPGDHGSAYDVLGRTLTLPLSQYGFPTALMVTLSVAALMLTVPVAAVLLVGLSRRAAGRPAQPHRTLLGGGRTAHQVTAGLVAWNLLVALLIATNTAFDFTVGVPAVALGALLGPAALVGWLVVRRTEHDGGAPLALSDVAHLVGRRRRRPLEVDQLVAVWTWPDPYALPAAGAD